MIKFEEGSIIFQGNGLHSMAACYHAHKLLDCSLDHLSAWQQGAGEESFNSYIRHVRELMFGLMGKSFSRDKIREFIMQACEPSAQEKGDEQATTEA